MILEQDDIFTVQAESACIKQINSAIAIQVPVGTNHRPGMGVNMRFLRH